MRTDTVTALADAEPRVFWLDTPARPPSRPALQAPARTDLAVVGGGYTGLWTALLAKERDPGRDVVLLEGDRIGWAASGRNGGFCAASLTHGEANGRERFPHEYPTLERMGLANLDAIEATVARYGIDCDFRRTGSLDVATEDYQVAGLQELAADGGGDFLDRAAVRAEVGSPTYLAGIWDRRGTALVDPAALAWGLAAAAEAAGVRVLEHTPVVDLARSGAGLALRTANGATVQADRVALGTNAFPSLLRRLRLHTVPVYDYVLMSEPLSPAQLDAIGWRHRQGIGDSANQFHYYRLTADNRILWGGYDADLPLRAQGPPRLRPAPGDVPHPRGALLRDLPPARGAALHPPVGRRDRHLHPLLRVLRHGAVRARGLRRSATPGSASGRAGSAPTSCSTCCPESAPSGPSWTLVRRKPLPFPPEPLAFAGIQATRWSLQRADRDEGRRNLWLRGLDRAGLGFDS